jgi:addiction module RelE/StbE family toxin
MVEINWTKFAIENLVDIGEYIAKDSQKYASITIEELFNAPNILLEFPKAGRIVPEIGNTNIREIIKGNYRVVYKIVNQNRIDILTVHHSKRLLQGTTALKKLF